MPDPLDLAALRAAAQEARERAQKATAGPWKVETDTDGDGEPFGHWWTYVRGVEQATDRGRIIFRYDDDYGTDQAADAGFIAAARSDVPKLASAVLDLAEEVQRLQANVHSLDLALSNAVVKQCEVATLRAQVERHRDALAALEAECAKKVTALLWCDSCGQQGVPNAAMVEGERCVLCGAEQREPFREGWDESD